MPDGEVDPGEIRVRMSSPTTIIPRSSGEIGPGFPVPLGRFGLGCPGRVPPGFFHQVSSETHGNPLRRDELLAVNAHQARSSGIRWGTP